MPRIVLRPSFSKEMDGLRRSARKHYQRACEIILEIQQDIEPSAPRRAETRIPKCRKFELPDGYRLVFQQGESEATMVALVIGTHDHVDAFLDGHKGFVFDEKTGRLRELRLATATETAVEMVPSAELQAEEQSSPQAAPPLFADFSEEMLLRLGVPQKDFGVLRSLTDPNSRAMPCPALSEKIFWFSEAANQFYIRSHPVPHRGALRNVTNAGRDAMDADGAPDVSTGRGRRRRVVLMPRRWHQVGGNIRK